MNSMHIARVFWMPVLFCFLLLPHRSSAQDKIRLGLSAVSATSGSIWVAEEKGLFKKHGLDAEVIIIGGGASRVVSSLEFIAAEAPKARGADPRFFVDESLVREIEASGIIKSLYEH